MTPLHEVLKSLLAEVAQALENNHHAEASLPAGAADRVAELLRRGVAAADDLDTDREAVQRALGAAAVLSAVLGMDQAVQDAIAAMLPPQPTPPWPPRWLDPLDAELLTRMGRLSNVNGDSTEPVASVVEAALACLNGQTLARQLSSTELNMLIALRAKGASTFMAAVVSAIQAVEAAQRAKAEEERAKWREKHPEDDPIPF